jgi:hypothetical protein
LSSTKKQKLTVQGFDAVVDILLNSYYRGCWKLEISSVDAATNMTMKQIKLNSNPEDKSSRSKGIQQSTNRNYSLLKSLKHYWRNKYTN